MAQLSHPYMTTGKTIALTRWTLIGRTHRWGATVSSTKSQFMVLERISSTRFVLTGIWLFCEVKDCNLPGFCLHWISQARILDWVAISFSRASSQPRDRTQVSCIVNRRFTIWATWEINTFLFYLGNGFWFFYNRLLNRLATCRSILQHESVKHYFIGEI